MYDDDRNRDVERAYLGRGWAFPPKWSLRQRSEGTEGWRASQRLQVHMVERTEDIRQAIHLILETHLGERVMQPEFGSDIHRYVFGSIDTQTKANLAQAVRRALVLWERRIREIEVEVAEHANEVGRLDVEISYRVDVHRMRQSLVFPYYVEQPERTR